MKAKGNKIKICLALVAFLIIVSLCAWFLAAKLEGTAPTVLIDTDSLILGAANDIPVTVSDEKSGLRRIWVGILKDGKEVVLAEKAFKGNGVMNSGSVRKTSFTIHVEPAKIGLTDGKATLRLMARDYAWRRWWHGNRMYREMEVTIDTRPPEISVLSRAHNITQGGAGLVVYRLSEPCPSSGIVVDDHFYPGHTGYFDDPDIGMALFALSHRQGKGTRMSVQATDRAGNINRAGFPHHIRRRVFKKDTIRISDGFLDLKMPEFSTALSQGAAPVEKFLDVNRRLRKANYIALQKICSQSSAKMLWSGPFLRLPNAANRAGFADRREYRYNGKVIDHQVHLGIDLASVAHSPVPAANSGMVAFVGRIGIYGETVVLDHGFGLFSMYAHLSAIDVQTGQQVAKKQIIGQTGTTGLAGGDHLHFSILIHDTFVNPLEWWDAAWIRHNITDKIAAAASGTGKG